MIKALAGQREKVFSFRLLVLQALSHAKKKRQPASQFEDALARPGSLQCSS
jgi:hypothetical protein